VEQLFNVTPLDIGRPLEHFTHRLDYTDLAKDASEVLRRLTTIEREIRDNNNRTYLTRFVPYRTVDDRIEGVVLNFVDITERKRAEEDLRTKMDELTRFNHALESNELRIIEMEKEVNELCLRVGEAARYPLKLEKE